MSSARIAAFTVARPAGHAVSRSDRRIRRFNTEGATLVRESPPPHLTRIDAVIDV